MSEKIGIIGLGYVGLPVALAFAKKFPGTVGFDIHEKKVDALRRGEDVTGEISSEELKSSPIKLTANPEDLKGITFFVVAVPTPVNENNTPDLTALRKASETVGKVITKGAVVVFESTVYPGVTEEVCGPVIEKISGLKCGVDFKLGYSPERINPGDKEHTLEKITKVVSGEDAETLERVAKTYEAIISAGVFRAQSIKVAEAAKVIENTQRDLNIALMNELSIIFDRLGIRTKDVLDAAGTKWNFLRFFPGLVGGHCIGVDPYYLTTKAEQLGYHPQVILAGRRINDDMGRFVAQRLIKMMIKNETPIKSAKVAILGVTFKENVNDTRNSRVPDIAWELEEFGVSALTHDPYACPDEVHEEYGVTLVSWESLQDLDAIIFTVPHHHYLDMPLSELTKSLKRGGIFIDVKSIVQPSSLRNDIQYWSL